MHSGLNSSEAPRFDYIDAVRGFAFVAVFLVHVSAIVGEFPGKSLIADSGYGVQLFFLASAVTLCYSMRSRCRSESHPILFFYLRRLFRILPLFWIAIALYWAIPGFRTHWLSQWAPGGVRPSYFLLNAAFLHGWFPNAFNSIVPGGWSIAVEMNFYLFFPVLFRWLGSSLKRSVGWVIASIFLLNILNHGFLHWIRGIAYIGVTDTVWQFFLHMWLPAQLPVFLIGFVLFQVLTNGTVQQVMRDRYWASCTLLFSSMLIFTVLTGRDRGFIPGYLLVVLGLAGCVLSVSSSAIPYVTNRFMRFLGKISYSAYLLHFAAINVTLWLLRFAHLTSSTVLDTGRPLQNLALFAGVGILSFALTVVLAACSLRFIENPGIALGRTLVKTLAKRLEGSQQLGADAAPKAPELVGA